MIWVTRRDRDGGEPITWIKQSLLQKYICVECQLKSDQALRLLCLKGHVRALGSTLWRHRWQEASEFLCTKKKSFWRELSNQKMDQKPRKCSLWRAINVTFSKFRGKRRKNKIAILSNPLINEFNQINSEPKILRSCLLHCSKKAIDKHNSPWDMCMCKVSSHQRPSPKIALMDVAFITRQEIV